MPMPMMRELQSREPQPIDTIPAYVKRARDVIPAQVATKSGANGAIVPYKRGVIPARRTTRPQTSCSSSPPPPPPPGLARHATKPPSAPSEPALAGEQGHKRNRSGEGSFGSSLGTISDIGMNDAKQPLRLAAVPTLPGPTDEEESGGGGSLNVVPPRTPPQAQLLPPAPLPQSQQSPLPRTHSSPGKTATTPGSSLNLGDFINVSPMPSAGAGVRERRLFGKIYALALFLYCRSS
ncbi:hypothetical protein PLICRDRAFT_172836 [Plicaturopsis crispa FD-325 SS-3]|nr:hypothetical protein PLICRDRAFT_172836 [Plicaturopsis crispa FD-325 SS-3]